MKPDFFCDLDALRGERLGDGNRRMIAGDVCQSPSRWASPRTDPRADDARHLRCVWRPHPPQAAARGLSPVSRGRLPAQFAVIGIARTQMDDEAFRTQFRDSLKEFAGADAHGDEVAASLASRMYYVTGETDDAGLYQRLAGAPDGDQRGRGRALLPRHSSDRLFDRDRAAGRLGSRRRTVQGLAAHHRREAVRHRPRQRARAQSARPPAFRRRSGLSHRSLSGEGNRPEPAGVPVRQRHVRAGLEPALHRPRPDHGRRDRRRRASRGVLRGRRRAARHGAEPPDAGARRSSRWSRRSPSPPRACGTARWMRCWRCNRSCRAAMERALRPARSCGRSIVPAG